MGGQVFSLFSTGSTGECPYAVTGCRLNKGLYDTRDDDARLMLPQKRDYYLANSKADAKSPTKQRWRLKAPAVDHQIIDPRPTRPSNDPNLTEVNPAIMAADFKATLGVS
jgi:hypothetical protein